jgi:hypothetical protein
MKSLQLYTLRPTCSHAHIFAAKDFFVVLRFSQLRVIPPGSEPEFPFWTMMYHEGNKAELGGHPVQFDFLSS